ncbi:MAG: DUF202 domain-containing protein [Candidatus Eremiobacteraeota bacterium]|nr:DUF202 domain-containing protein [Candidatus Eremiobacteraeota bacterium]MBC5803068.1 DUF202 domain-containing protein [Candidatus Eremiobacteraeota bacterium]MBC5820510.1 DUF202 domain-containing protein [Candidatus Eremiobacteraeota bacterium]
MNSSEIRATDVLANERTLLAYMRTALAFVAFGFVVARFALFERELTVVTHPAFPHAHASTPFGIATALAGAAVGVYGALRYIITDTALRRGRTSAMPPWAAGVVGGVTAAIGILVAVDLSAFR